MAGILLFISNLYCSVLFYHFVIFVLHILFCWHWNIRPENTKQLRFISKPLETRTIDSFLNEILKFYNNAVRVRRKIKNVSSGFQRTVRETSFILFHGGLTLLYENDRDVQNVFRSTYIICLSHWFVPFRALEIALGYKSRYNQLELDSGAVSDGMFI